MENFKGTKGNWEPGYGDNISIEIVLENNTTISIDRYDRYNGNVVGERSEMVANAKLISKAPEMLEMLKIARDKFLDLKHDNKLPELQEIQSEIENLIKEATEL